MAKKKNNTTAPKAVAKEEVTNEEVTNETPETVEETPEVVENVAETPEVVEEAPKAKKSEKTPEAPAPAGKSKKQTFEESIAKTPYVIYQNGIMICHSNPHLVIKTTDKYFEINFKKFSYAGIEVKHK